MALALFDLDNTLLAGDSDHLWGEFLAEQGIVDADWHQAENERYYQAYQAGTLDILAFLEFALAPLAEHDSTILKSWRRIFIKEKIMPIIAAGTHELIHKHRRAGDTLAIITATNSFVTTPIAELLEIPHLLATEPEIIDGRYTGKVTGPPCFREGKIDKLNHWRTQYQASLAGSFFYSDSHNDLPLLGIVDHPVAVDPDPRLAAHAKESGWPIISLR